MNFDIGTNDHLRDHQQRLGVLEREMQKLAAEVNRNQGKTALKISVLYVLVAFLILLVVGLAVQ